MVDLHVTIRNFIMGDTSMSLLVFVNNNNNNCQLYVLINSDVY